MGVGADRSSAAPGDTIVYSFVVTYILGLILQKTIGFRIDAEDEVSGIDLAAHAESAYDLASSSTGTFRPTSGSVTVTSQEVPA